MNHLPPLERERPSPKSVVQLGNILKTHFQLADRSGSACWPVEQIYRDLGRYGGWTRERIDRAIEHLVDTGEAEFTAGDATSGFLQIRLLLNTTTEPQPQCHR